MKTLLKSILTASLLLATTAAPAQRMVQDIEDWMDANISRVTDAKIDVQKSLGQERDVQQTGAPLKWRCDTYSFTLPKKRRQLLDEMKKAFEDNGHDNPNCYSINSQTETPDGDIYGHHRNLMIGDDVNRYVTIGKDYNNYLNINILDAADTTKTHRYAYALEWREARKGAVDVRYVVTYAKIPSTTTSIRTDYFSLQRNPVLNIGPSIINDKTIRFKHGQIVTDSLPKSSDYSADDLLCNENILLIFSQLKQQYLAGQNQEFNAISIYNLCRRARAFGFFTHKESKEDLAQMKREITTLLKDAEKTSYKVYFGLALSELEWIR